MILPLFRLLKLQFRESPMVQEKRANHEAQRSQARAAIRALRAWGLILLMCFPIGCVVNRSQLDQTLRADRGTAARNEGVAEHYLVACPDVLDIAVAGRPEISGRRPVEPDGCLDLGQLGRVHVEELPLP